ncbi:MAG TPA: uL15 family ribosomal protein [Candidatus Paceibacterota bacterium]|nr:uL15 family ribosomal protein [Candidatus Paceibacterota bacterium]
MHVHQLPSIQKKTQRIGRSGKRGSYSGRGVKGQKSRSGHRIRPAERDLIIRLPKMRGFRNKQKDINEHVLNLNLLAARLQSRAKGPAPLAVNHELLREAGLLHKNFRGIVKVLGTGDIAFPIAVAGLKVSESAKAKIQKAGGSVT